MNRIDTKVLAVIITVVCASVLIFVNDALAKDTQIALLNVQIKTANTEIQNIRDISAKLEDEIALLKEEKETLETKSEALEIKNETLENEKMNSLPRWTSLKGRTATC